NLEPASEKPFPHPDDVPRLHLAARIDIDFLFVVGASVLDVNLALARAIGEAASKRHRIEHIHAVDVSGLAGLVHFADDEERPVVRYFHADTRTFQIALRKLGRYIAFELMHGAACRLDLPDQRQAHMAGVIHAELAGEIGLTEHDHAE